MHWLRLIRWKNLSIIVLTQWLCWWGVIVPEFQKTGIAPVLTPVHFWLLCISTVLIAAAGYIINDYFDIRIDAINQPERVVLEKSIPRRDAIIAHTLLNITALVLAAIVARAAGHYEYLLLQAGCMTLLWFYSTHFKRQFVTGNFIVSLLTGLTIITLLLYEYQLLQTTEISTYILLVYAGFAFLLNWMREVVKDMEDLKGDEAEGCVTMPIVWGLKRTIFFVRIIGAVTFVLLLCMAIPLLYGMLIVWSLYALLALALPLLLWMVRISSSYTAVHFHLMSRWLKIIMLLGIGLLLIYRFLYA